MSVKLYLFVLAEVSAERQQLGRSLPSDYQQEGSNLPSTSSYIAPHVRMNACAHTSWQYKDLFLSVKSPQYDRKCHTLARDAHRSTANLLSSASYIRVNFGLYGPPFGVLRWHRRGNTRSLHAQNLSAGKSDLRANLRASSDEIRVKYWQARAFCGELRAAKFVPRSLPARLARKGVTGALYTIISNRSI